MQRQKPQDFHQKQTPLNPLTLSTVLNESVTDFDLFIKIGGHMVLYAPKPYYWSKEEIARLMKDGHKELYYESHLESRVETYRQICLWPSVDYNLAPEKRIQKIVDLAAQFSKVLFEHEFTQSAFDRGQQIAKDLTACILEKPNCIKALEQLKEHHQYTYYHSARVSAYATAIALQMSLSDADGLNAVSLGCMLHDIGKSAIPHAILNKPGSLNSQEWDLVRKHPEHGLRIVSETSLSVVPCEIIVHHHEREDGGGYPHRISGSELMTEVKIAGFADVFDALTSHRPYQSTRTRFEAMAFIKDHLLKHIYLEAYKAMIGLLGQ